MSQGGTGSVGVCHRVLDVYVACVGGGEVTITGESLIRVIQQSEYGKILNYEQKR